MKKSTLSIVILAAALAIALLNMVLLHEEINELEQNLLIVQDENYGLWQELVIRDDMLNQIEARQASERALEGKEEEK